MYGYIYLTTNLINNKKYIGRRTSKKFLETDYLGSGIHLKNAVAKYGRENFKVELLEECDSLDDLISKETYYIVKYNAVESDEYYNHSYGGPDEGFVKGGENIAKSERSRKINSDKHRGKKMPAVFVEKQRQLHLGKPSGMLGKHHSEETKKLIGEASRKHNLERDPEVYKKTAQTKLGNKMMNRDGVCIRVHPEDFEAYLNDGWNFGGLPRKVDKSGNKNPMYGKSAVKGKVFIHRGTELKLVKKEDIESYTSNGWSLGMKDKHQ